MKDLDTWQVWEVFGSVWSDLLVLHKYSVIISECQKVTFLEVKVKKKVEKKVEKLKLNGETSLNQEMKDIFAKKEDPH